MKTQKSLPSYPAGTLVGKRGKAGVAHVWSGTDTACHMYSTGGMRKHRLEWGTALDERPRCKMCCAVAHRRSDDVESTPPERPQYDWRATQAPVEAPQVVYLTCTLKDRHEVKRRGARWDSQASRWYVMRDADLGPFMRWLPDYEEWAAGLSSQALADLAT